MDEREEVVLQAEEIVSDRILTLPNAITVVRLLCLPIFLWLLFHDENRAAAAWFLGGLGATDFVDGYVARHFHQTSALGKILKRELRQRPTPPTPAPTPSEKERSVA